MKPMKKLSHFFTFGDVKNFAPSRNWGIAADGIKWWKLKNVLYIFFFVLRGSDEGKLEKCLRCASDTKYLAEWKDVAQKRSKAEKTWFLMQHVDFLCRQLQCDIGTFKLCFRRRKWWVIMFWIKILNFYFSMVQNEAKSVCWKTAATGQVSEKPYAGRLWWLRQYLHVFCFSVFISPA